MSIWIFIVVMLPISLLIFFSSRNEQFHNKLVRRINWFCNKVLFCYMSFICILVSLLNIRKWYKKPAGDAEVYRLVYVLLHSWTVNLLIPRKYAVRIKSGYKIFCRRRGVRYPEKLRDLEFQCGKTPIRKQYI